MSTNVTIEDAVKDSLALDPRISDSDQIAVSAEPGTVCLRGTVGSFSQRRAAVEDAKKIRGVYEVDDELQVRLLDGAKREDAALRGMALQTLVWDSEVPADLIDVKVDKGWVTLSGDVSHQFESDAAYKDVAHLIGVVGVTNDIQVTTP